ncbi:MAG TPA: hypothetical protein K8U83_04555 [Corynebacterium stationis]|uniref:hypothetical protein n=1 Tax=Corynebacterium stationis TaxID=1705 RepID=UPI001D3C2CD7|nr:hypothetical protein [Corynebacterium stationis]HJG64039.1 hypothetical protein [Corynebacterium stationis]
MTASFRLPPLVADGGELRLARRVASFVYGRREVEWPEDVDDPEELLPDGREFGWVAKLEDSEPGLSERRFVRADVKINAAEGYSDVEQVLDDSALRAGGEVYFESVIEEDGLGLLVPGVDFRQGDLVDVRFWGRILKDQLVTSIDWVDGKPSVALGGQSIRDTGELARARAEMVRLINGERADRVDDVSKVSKRVDTVDEKAEDALSGVDDVRAALAGEGATTEDLQAALDALNQQLQEQGEGSEESLSLIQAYIAANTARWELQQKVDEMQDRVSADLQAQQIAMKEEFEADRASRPEKVIASAAGSSNPAYPVTNLPNGDWQMRLTDVAGAIVILDTWEVSGQDRISPIAKQYTPTTNPLIVTRNSSQVVSCEWVRTAGIVRAVNETWTGKQHFSGANEWHLLDMVPDMSVGASGTDNFDMTVSIRFPDGWSYYRLQIRAGNKILADKTAQGSSTIFKTVPLTVNLSVSSATISPNTDVRIYYMKWGQSSLGNSAINRITTRASWTERNV